MWRVTLPEVCVVYVVREIDERREVLLGRKKTGLGLGKFVGLGGKLHPGESPLDAAMREAEEEATIALDRRTLRNAGAIDYEFPTKPAWNQRSHVFVCTAWTGSPAETDELVPEWFPLDRIPFDAMWDDARFWLPGVLNGGEVQRRYEFGSDLNSVVRSET